jgi:hypothetical protein
MSSTTIAAVRGRRVWDSRGRPTVEAEVRLAGGALGRAIAPAGASTGSAEALDRRDGGTSFGGLDVTGAVAAVSGEIAAALAGLDAGDQAAVDRILIELDGTPDKSRLGGNALIATSMAVAHAAAAAAGLPLWRHLGGTDEARLPLPEIQVFGGGAHAAGRLDVQDFMVIAVGASGPASRRAGTSRSRSTSPPPSSGVGAATACRATAASSTATASRNCCSTGSPATPSSRSRTRWARTTRPASGASPGRSASASPWSATTTS